MPEGEDPDTLVRRGGAAALAPILKDAVDVLDRKIQLLERKGWFQEDNLEHRRDALDKLLPTARAAADPITRDLYVKRIVDLTGVSRPVVEQQLAAHREPPPPAPEGAAAPRGAPAPRPAARVRRPGARLEEQLLVTLVAAESWIARARTEVAPETFEVPAYREIFDALVALPAGTPPGAAAPAVSPRAQEALQRLLQRAAEDRADGLNFDEVYVGALRGLRSRAVAQSLAPVLSVRERQSQLQELPPEERQRLAIRRQAEQARRRSTERGGGPDHSQNP